MILENLCLDSLILYFNTLKDIYNQLYAKKSEEEKNANNSVNHNVLNQFVNHDNDNDNENDIDNLNEEDIFK